MHKIQAKLTQLIDEVSKVIIGQWELKRDITIALMCSWHILIEWAPGLGKTRLVKAFSQATHLQESRIQFTPDLLPSDIIGARIYDPDAKEFEIKKGPIFAHFILADEINRAPSKVQSALLQAMEELEVTIAEKTFSLPQPFIVLATQNPLEQEGTHELPEAQMDRFLLQSQVPYPSIQEEKEILMSADTRNAQKISSCITKEDISEIQQHLTTIQVSESLYEYICNIIAYSREITKLTELNYGASPRASLAILQTSRAYALLQWRDYVLPEDIKEMAYPVLRHRLSLSYEALAQWISTDDVITKILSLVPLNH